MAALTSAQVEQFQREGYLLVENMFDPVADIDPIIAEYAGVLDSLADKLYAQGAISSTHAELPFGQRLIEIYKESGAVHAQYFDFSLPQADVRVRAVEEVVRVLRGERPRCPVNEIG